MEGRYNDILVPEENFIPVSADFSNLDDVMERLRDLDHCQTIARNTFDAVMSSHCYRHRMARLEELLRALP